MPVDLLLKENSDSAFTLLTWWCEGLFDGIILS